MNKSISFICHIKTIFLRHGADFSCDFSKLRVEEKCNFDFNGTLESGKLGPDLISIEKNYVWLLQSSNKSYSLHDQRAKAITFLLIVWDFV